MYATQSRNKREITDMLTPQAHDLLFIVIIVTKSADVRMSLYIHTQQQP